MRRLTHSSSDLLQIRVKMGASWSAQVFRQAGGTPSGPGCLPSLVLSEDLAHVIFTELQVWERLGLQEM